jgi:hypothetical protein
MRLYYTLSDYPHAIRGRMRQVPSSRSTADCSATRGARAGHQAARPVAGDRALPEVGQHERSLRGGIFAIKSDALAAMGTR